MRTIINFLKRNAFNLICAVVAVAAVALGVTGLQAMTQVEEKLNEVVSLHGQVTAPLRKPVNDKVVEAQRQRVETIQANFKAVMDKALSLNQYIPLEPPAGETFFPEPTRDGGLEFKKIYPQQFDALLTRLNAGGPPGDNDIAQMQEQIEEENSARKFRGGEEQPPDDAGKDDEKNVGGVPTDREAMQSAEVRASVVRAKRIYCYATRDAFDENMGVYRGMTPRPHEMWRAQVALWVQQDVVEALATINDEAAEAYSSAHGGRRAWVGVLPIKEIISISVSDYLPLTGKGGKAPRRSLIGRAPAEPPGDAGLVFTGNSSTDMYELLQFTVKMVIDPRKMPLIIDRIGHDRFHALLNLSYAYDRETVENRQMTGRIYGDQPAVIVLMDFETIFFGDIYRRTMPESVLGAIGKERPEDPTSDDT